MTNKSKPSQKYVFEFWIIVVVLSWRFGLFELSRLADSLLKYQPTFPYYHSILPFSRLPRWIYSWANFDGVHYITIAQKGYVGTGLIQAFFPLYPKLIHFLAGVGGHDLLAGLVVSHISFALLIWGWIKLCKTYFPSWSGRQLLISLCWLLLFPTSFFFGSVYTESLFLGLVVWFFVCVKKHYWWRAAILAGLASATRVVGIFLAVSLTVEYLIWLSSNNHIFEIIKAKFSQNLFQEFIHKVLKRKKELLKLLPLLLLAGSGLLLYQWYLLNEFHDPLYFLHVQAEFGAGRQEKLIMLPQVFWRYCKILYTARPINLKYYSYVQDLGMSILAGSALWYGFKRKALLSLMVFSALALFLPTLTGTFSSMPRYILSAPGVLMSLVIWSQVSRRRLYLGLLISTILLEVNTLLFIQGYWIA